MKKLSFVLFIIFIYGCDESKNLIQPKEGKALDITQTYDTLEYLNFFRKNSGLVELSKNERLSQAAYNHALYSSFHKKAGHDEVKEAYFTGKTPSNRAFNVGYNSSFVGENIAYKNNFKSSIDILFTAIYHRFNFLSFDKNEVGFSIQHNGDFSSAVFVLGNKGLNELCSQNQSFKYGKFYTNICKNKSLRIKENDYKKAMNFANSDIIIFPYQNAQNIPIAFSGETPDPMPSCKITANPISVQFKPSSKKIQLVSFKIFSKNKELENTKIITKTNDINKHFSEFEFALFPLDVFDFNTTYTAVFEYKENKIHKKIKWNFTTNTPKFPYFIANSNENLALEPDIYYNIFLKPKHCNDLLSKFSIISKNHSNFQYSADGANMLKVKLNGYKNDNVIIESNEKRINLILQKSSEILQTDFKKHFIIAAALLILAYFIARKKY